MTEKQKTCKILRCELCGDLVGKFEKSHYKINEGVIQTGISKNDKDLIASFCGYKCHNRFIKQKGLFGELIPKEKVSDFLVIVDKLITNSTMELHKPCHEDMCYGCEIKKEYVLAKEQLLGEK